MKKPLLLCFVLALASCRSAVVTNLNTHFDPTKTPSAPNYALPENWAALPNKADEADKVPVGANIKDEQATAQADVFFVHPTIFTYKPTNGYEWNGDVNDAVLNQKTDESTILNQASIFNGSCRVFAPRYRQAHIAAFYTNNKQDAAQALDLAYQDVREAFRHYLAHNNQGRPIVIASHSQGTVHCVRLLKEFFDGKPLQKRLVAAYLIGRAVKASEFSQIKPSQSAEDLGGIISWNTYAKGYYPDFFESYIKGSVSTNPLTWKTDEAYAPATLNKGGVGLKFTMYPQVIDAQNHESMLWVGTPNIKGAKLLRTKVWHKADMNFFWLNIRENVALRIQKMKANER